MTESLTQPGLSTSASPYFLKQIIEALSDPSSERLSNAYVYAFLALVSTTLKAQSDLYHLW